MLGFFVFMGCCQVYCARWYWFSIGYVIFSSNCCSRFLPDFCALVQDCCTRLSFYLAGVGVSPTPLCWVVRVIVRCYLILVWLASPGLSEGEVIFCLPVGSVWLCMVLWYLWASCSMSHGFLIFFVDNSYGGFLCVGVWVRVWGVYFFSDVPLDVTFGT